MNTSLRRFASMIFALGFTLGLGACGGNSGSTPVAVVDTSGSAAVVALKMTDNVTGSGAVAAKGNVVTVHYTGWLYDVKASDLRGTKFDSSVDRGQTFDFAVGAGQVIKGWDQGVVGMKVGGQRTLIIPSSLAYGSSVSASIPANAALVFDVRLIAVQ